LLPFPSTSVPLHGKSRLARKPLGLILFFPSLPFFFLPCLVSLSCCGVSMIPIEVHPIRLSFPLLSFFFRVSFETCLVRLSDHSMEVFPSPSCVPPLPWPLHRPRATVCFFPGWTPFGVLFREVPSFPTRFPLLRPLAEITEFLHAPPLSSLSSPNLSFNPLSFAWSFLFRHSPSLMFPPIPSLVFRILVLPRLVGTLSPFSLCLFPSFS